MQIVITTHICVDEAFHLYASRFAVEPGLDPGRITAFWHFITLFWSPSIVQFWAETSVIKYQKQTFFGQGSPPSRLFYTRDYRPSFQGSHDSKKIETHLWSDTVAMACCVVLTKLEKINTNKSALQEQLTDFMLECSTISKTLTVMGLSNITVELLTSYLIRFSWKDGI